MHSRTLIWTIPRFLHHFPRNFLRQKSFGHYSKMSTARITDPIQSDLVFVRELFVKAVTGVDAWKRLQPQPISVSLFFQADLKTAGVTDHLGHSLNYDVISRHVTKAVENGRFKTLEDVTNTVAEAALDYQILGNCVRIHVRKPRALLRAESAEIVVSRMRSSVNERAIRVQNTIDQVKINKLQLITIIGVNNIERIHKQTVVIDLILHKPSGRPEYDVQYDFRKVAETVEEHVENSNYKTIEAFASSVAEVVCLFGVEKATVRAAKPSAITFAEAAGVEITRSRGDFAEGHLAGGHLTGGYSTVTDLTGTNLTREDTKESISDRSNSSISTSSITSTPQFPESGTITDGPHKVYLAFGSNVGDTTANIRQAIEYLNGSGVHVIKTSSLYESCPMYVKDQEKFVNGVLECQTELKPLELLDCIKDIEYNRLKRVKHMDNGPRSIDLDIILYDDLVMNHERLSIPHPGMLQRSFVLRPLVEIISDTETHPITVEPYEVHLEQIPQETDQQESSSLRTKIPLDHGECLLFDPDHRHESTLIMAILNITPDSFSDGGKITADNIVKEALKAVESGAHILDVGGMSTNPKSVDPGAEEELKRVETAIKALRSCKKLDNIPISIDTFRSSVAEIACRNGVDIINDISAGQLDPEIFKVAVKYRKPIILNHTRGTPQTMNSLADYKSSDRNIVDNSVEAVVACVADELEQRVQEAMDAGIPRWQLILDPGLGFAKLQNHSMAIVRNLDKLMASKRLFQGLPWLLGPSRKGFIGKITGDLVPSERIFGTAAVVTSNIEKGADIVRVHDVEEMAKVVKMADEIYRKR